MATLANPVGALGNTTLSYGGTAIESHLDNASLTVPVDSVDTTNLASTNASEILTGEDWGITASGFWNPTLDGVLGPDAITPPTVLKDLVFVVGPTGSTTTFTWTAKTFVQEYTIEFDAEGLARFDVTFALSGAPTIS